MKKKIWYTLRKYQKKERIKMKLNGHIFLIGFMGCGKSTNAACLSKLTGACQMEMDQEIVRSQGMEISEIFAAHGETYFRDLETALLKSLKGKEPMVVSCGGGAVLREENVALMKDMGTIVLLTAEPETIYERVKDSKERPVLNGNMNLGYIEELMEKRRPRYEKAAELTVSTDGRGAEDICREILKIQELNMQEAAEGRK